MLYALQFVMPSSEELINLLLLCLVLAAVFFIASKIIKHELFHTVALFIAGIIAIIMLLSTFTTWGG